MNTWDSPYQVIIFRTDDKETVMDVQRFETIEDAAEYVMEFNANQTAYHAQLAAEGD